MARVKTTNRNHSVRSGKRHHGFTLVELIVVIAILAILAAAGVFVAVGYINRSRFDQNSQNAITVYQTAQTALAHKVDDGTIHKWVEQTVFLGDGGFTETDFKNNGNDVLVKTNESIHKTVYLTFNPGNTDNELYKLLNGYFYDASIFAGTISVEFDISATLQNDGNISYSAIVLSAFYSKDNKVSNGWDSDCQGSSSDGLPQRDYEYRRHTSYVGYYNGSKESIVGPVPVALPNLDVAVVDFTLRNGETLDATWTIFGNNSHNAKLKLTLSDTENETVDLMIDEESIIYSWKKPTEPQPITYDDNIAAYKDGTYVSKEDERNTVYEYVMVDYDEYKIKKTSSEALALVRYNDAYYQIPLTVTYVEGDNRDALHEAGYTTYTLNLDCMMVRADYQADDTYGVFTIDRFFGNTPKNISATLEGTASGFTIDKTVASRAIDDPVYFEKVDLKTWGTGSAQSARATYCYNVTGAGANDEGDKCVVNTLFGDAVYNEGDSNIVGTTYSQSEGVNAVITCFRHLSNIRKIADGTQANYFIVRDLNWYEKVNGHYTSEVRVFKNHTDSDNQRQYAGYTVTALSRSPIINHELKIVSFPAIHQLNANQTLTSLPHRDGNDLVESKINNVQLRVRSFNKSEDNGYGLVCENDGTIYNIYTDNLNMVLVDVKNGAANDYTGGNSQDNCIYPDVDDVTIEEGKNNTYGMVLNNKPVGGVVGLNKGSIGLDGANDSGNTIRSDNSIIMAGHYWVFMWFNEGVGGIVGRNEGSTYGVLELNGNFAVLGQKHVGGIIGYSDGNIGASLYINNPDTVVNDSEFEFPVESRTGKKISCVVASKYTSGGAIGFVQNSDFTAVADSFTSSNANPDTGEITYSGPYQISVNLPANSLVLSVCDDKENRFNGGVIGSMKNCKGYLSINLDNKGDVILHEFDRKYVSYCGGVIGYEDNCSASLVINAQYGSNTRIGSFSDSDSNEVLPDSTGGAIGYVANKDQARTIAIKITSDAVITARSNREACGAGGAIGGINSTSSINNLYIDATNNGGIYSKPTEDDDKTDGTGGAIGCLYSNNANYTTNSIIRVINKGTISGGRYIGGVIGYSRMDNDKLFIQSTGLIKGLNYVGGAVGYNANAINSVSSKMLSASRVTGENYTAGAIGYNEDEIGSIVVELTSSGVTGLTYTAGAVGRNRATITSINATVISTDIVGKNYTAGAVGSNEAVIGTIVASMTSSSVDGNTYTAGGVGYNISAINSVTVKMSSGSNIEGYDYTAGGIGFNNVDIAAIDVEFADASKLSGDNYVGGAVGHAEKGTYTSVTVAYSGSSSEPIIQCVRFSGGVFGQLGNETDGASATSINCTISVGSFIQQKSGTVAYNDDAYVGGLIGWICSNSSVDSIKLEGTGGTVDPSNADANLSSKSYPKTYMVSAAGNSVGGLIGQIGVANDNNQIVIPTIDTASGPNICVVSTSDDSTGIGGWVGKSYGCYAGLGSGDSGNLSTYYVTNVYAVYGKGDEVGAFCGRLDAANGDSKKVYANITVDISYATIVGDGYTGGLVGRMNQIDYFSLKNINMSGLYVEGAINVGGLIGLADECKIENQMFNGTVTGASNLSVIGTEDVGGFIGEYYDPSNTGFNMGDLSVTANTFVIRGEKHVGGVIGCTTLGSGTLSGNVSLKLSNNSSVTGTSDDVGGAFGLWENGNLPDGISISLASGSAVFGIDHVGGAIGKWESGELDNGINVTLSNSAVTGEDNVAGAVGYWNGSSFKGGITLNATDSKIEGRLYVGGALSQLSTGDFEGGMIINYSGTTVTGVEDVGGAIGIMDGGYFSGGMTINYTNNSYLGDDPTKPSTDWKCIEVGGAVAYLGAYNGIVWNSGRICIEIDGTSKIFAGLTEDTYNTTSGNYRVTFEEAGVGGAFGRLGETGKKLLPELITYDKDLNYDNENNYDAYIQVLCQSSNVTIESNGSNVGGLVGHMHSGTFYRSFSTAVIKGINNVGGVVGCFDGGKFCQCYSGGHTNGGQYLPGSENIVGVNNVGGFAGLVTATFDTAGAFTHSNIKEDMFQCYSTSSVRGSSCVGGFIGSEEYNNNGKAATTSQCYCTGLVSLNEGGDDRTRGAFAGYAFREGAFTGANKNTSKVLRYVNGDLRRVGMVGTNTSANNCQENRVHYAYWGACDSSDVVNYIRIDPKSQYEVYPFDNTLDATDSSFPLRTFISYKQTSGPDKGKWKGMHYGDWPTVMSASTVMLNDSVATIEFVDENGNPIDDEFIYTIGGVKPNVKVWVTDALGNRIDATELGYVKVTYSNNNAVGTATVMVSGDGEHYGSVITKNFTIVPLNITDATVTTEPGSYTYDGTAHEPVVTVSLQDGENTIVIPPEDYTVTFGDCTNAGNVEVTVTPDATKYIVNNESVTLIGGFTIDPVQLEAEKIKITCSGTVDAPVITVAIITDDGDVTLTDEQFSYELNTDDEKLTVSVNTGNYYTEDIVLIVHKVTFMTDETTVFVSCVVLDDQLVTMPDTNPDVEGKRFLGWVTEENVSFDETEAIKNSMAIFASWEEINAGGGEGGGEQGGGSGAGGESGGEQGGESGGSESGGEQGGESGSESGGEQGGESGGGESGSEQGGESGSESGGEQGGESGGSESGGEQGGESGEGGESGGEQSGESGSNSESGNEGGSTEP